MGGARALLAGATLLLAARGAHGMYMLFSHYDLAGQGAAFAYAPVPYGRLGSYFPDAYKYMPYDRQPLYYDPRDPHGARPVAGALNYSDPYRGAAYLPQELMGRHNALFPAFGHIPLNYVPPNYHPTWPGGAVLPPLRFSHPEGFLDLVPYQVPFPGWTSAATTHPLYAPWYNPGVALRRFHRNPKADGGPLADRPSPMMKDRVERPVSMDRPSSWPSMGPNDPYATVPKDPPPPPAKDAAAGTTV